MTQKSKQLNLIMFCLLILAIGVFFGIPKRLTPHNISSVGSGQPQTRNETKQTIVDVPKAQAASQPISGSLRVPVLMYHHVGYLADYSSADLTVSPEDFESQVRYFIDLGYHSVTVQDIYDAIVNGKPLPIRPIVFTFDDGYKDVFTYAVPILKKYGSVGSLAIATELLGRQNYAVLADVVDAKKQGMEIISHTQNHLDLSNPIYSVDDLHREIFGSKQLLEEKLGTAVDFFVYPYGHYNEKVIQMVKQAGYKMAFTTAYGMDLGTQNMLTEPRVRVHGQNGLDKLKIIFSPAPKPQSEAALLSP